MHKGNHHALHSRIIRRIPLNTLHFDSSNVDLRLVPIWHIKGESLQACHGWGDLSKHGVVDAIHKDLCTLLLVPM